MMNVLEMIKLVQGTARSESEQLKALATLGAPPGEDFAPESVIPVTNSIPAFSLKGPGVGSYIAGQDYGVAAPVPDQKILAPSTLGKLLIGEAHGDV